MFAVNVSALEFCHRDFFDHAFAVMEATGVEPSCLQLELTEGVPMRDVATSACQWDHGQRGDRHGQEPASACQHGSTRWPRVARVPLFHTEGSVGGRSWRRANGGTLGLLVPVFDIDRVGALHDPNCPYRIQFGRSSEGDDVASGQEGRFVHSLRFIVPPSEQPREYLTERVPMASVGCAASLANLGRADE